MMDKLDNVIKLLTAINKELKPGSHIIARPVINGKPLEAMPAKATLTRQDNFNRAMSYRFYKKACKENAERIKKIQEHFPGWVPVISYNLQGNTTM